MYNSVETSVFFCSPTYPLCISGDRPAGQSASEYSVSRLGGQVDRYSNSVVISTINRLLRIDNEINNLRDKLNAAA